MPVKLRTATCASGWNHKLLQLQLMLGIVVYSMRFAHPVAAAAAAVVASRWCSCPDLDRR